MVLPLQLVKVSATAQVNYEHFSPTNQALCWHKGRNATQVAHRALQKGCQLPVCHSLTLSTMFLTAAASTDISPILAFMFVTHASGIQHGPGNQGTRGLGYYYDPGKSLQLPGTASTSINELLAQAIFKESFNYKIVR